MTYCDYLRKACELLALEFNCSPEDFLKSENVLTVSRPGEGRRIYTSDKLFFQMATLGNNAVITADKCMQTFLREYIKNKMGHWLFEIPNLLPIQRELEKHGYTLTQTHHLFLPCRDVVVTKERPVKWYYGSGLSQFRADSRFPNAIEAMDCETESPLRMAVCAYDGDQIMGMAACAEDAPNWYQIGIDVLSEYRSQGIGTHLVGLMKKQIIRQNGIPYYITSIAGYHSWNIALACGFKPAWVEISAERL